MKIQQEKIHPFLKLTGYKPEKKVVLNRAEMKTLKDAQAILDKGSELNKKICPHLEPHEDTFFIASVEIDYILEASLDEQIKGEVKG